MDALDLRILRELGMEPFVGWDQRPRGLKTSDVARRLDVGEHLVKDRIQRMTEAGVIVGYQLMPNLRHCGQAVTVCHLESATVPDAKRMSRLADVDGFDRVVWFLDSGLCINLSHASDAERKRRIGILARLVDFDGTPKVLYTIDFPEVGRSLTELDWRIIRALASNARRPIQEVAKEVGVTTKTVRTRLNRMREEGSVDEYAIVDLGKLDGVYPFQMAVWFEPGEDPTAKLMDAFVDRHLADFTPPPQEGYSPFMLRIFAYTPAEVQALVRDALDVRGVERAEALVPTGAWVNQGWMLELLDAHSPAAVPST
jgi:DNA-binding Lrp family transcriptional regulator